ncbi:MAG TPA: hypothetical protein VJK51_00015 [Candidatus Nanoarchaeia archaeon]|nr:hypothetical protein [Candidatus Nanoarchaeia archaeon]
MKRRKQLTGLVRLSVVGALFLHLLRLRTIQERKQLFKQYKQVFT